MSQRKITKRQRERIKAMHAKRRQQLEHVDEEQFKNLGPKQEGLVIAHFGKTALIEDSARNIYHCQLRQQLDILVPGDRVVWQAIDNKQGVVVACMLRGNQLARQTTAKQLKPIAANLNNVIITTAYEPALSTLFIDRYLVALEYLKLNSIIIFNKIDLTTTNEKKTIQHQLKYYEQIGYKVLFVSALKDRGLSKLKRILNGNVSVFVGQSGVGKSTLIKQLIPDKNITTKKLSEISRLGTHTTSIARLYHLPSGGELIDSPGVRDFQLWDMAASDVAKGFIEFAPYIGHCKFKNCSHHHEPKCAIINAVKNNDIAKSRYDSFLQIIGKS